MKRSSLQVVVVGLLCMCLGWLQGAGVASATAVSDSYAEFQWNSLEIIGNITVSDVGMVDDAGAWVSDWSGFSDASGAPEALATGASGSKLGAVNSNVFKASGTLSSSGNGWASGWAYADRSFDFTANATGWVTFKLPWVLSVTLDTDHAGEYAYSEVSYQLVIQYATGGREAYDWLWGEASDGSMFQLDDAGVASVRAYFTEGQTGTFTASVSDYNNVTSPVPVPPSVLLLGSGLLGLLRVGLRSRKGD